MENGLVSVIVPVYNIEGYLRQCLDSVVKQTYGRLQIILVDDGSTDGSGGICDEYAAADQRIRVIHQDNLGLCGARNSGLDEALGEYILFVDGDDWIDSTLCEDAVRAAEAHNADIVMWSYVREFNNNSINKYLYGTEEKLCTGDEYKKIYRRLIGPVGEETAAPQNLEVMSPVCTKLYRSSCIGSLRFSMLIRCDGEDTLFNTFCLAQAESLYYLGSCPYHYRKVNSASITHTYKSDLIDKRLYIFSTMREVIRRKGLEEYMSEALSNRIAVDILGIGLNICRRNGLSRSEKKSELKKALNIPEYHDAVQRFDESYMPLHWKIYYRCAKKQRVGTMINMCTAIQFLRSKL